MIPVSAGPKLLLEFDGLPLEGGASFVVSSVTVRQLLSAPSQCQITITDHGGRKQPQPVKLGAELSVTIDGDALFDGDVTAVEHSYGPANEHEIHVRAYDRLHRLRKRQSVKAHLEVTPADLARELVSGDGLTVDAADPGPLFRNIVQSVESDLDLLLDIAGRCGISIYLNGRTLRFLTGAGTGVSVGLKLGKDLLEARIEANGDCACRSVTTDAWDTARAEHHQGRASSARHGRSVPADVTPAAMHGTGERFLVDEIAHNNRQADLLAQAELDVRGAREIVFTGVASGDVRLMPGVSVDLDGVEDDYCGRYVLTSVLHVVSPQTGYVAEFSTEPPPPRPRPRAAATAMAVVTRVDDPENLGRVQVMLPAYSNVETGWVPVLTAGAGAHKGFTILPDVDDIVLVLMPRQDPAEAIVLGGLFGVNGPPDPGVEQGKTRRWLLRTPGGHRLLFDDSTNSLRLEDSGGSYLEFSQRQVLLHAAADLRVEAAGHAISIAGATVDFEKL